MTPTLTQLAKEEESVWYFITTFSCPICASEKTYRERRSSPKPDGWEERHEVIDAWDYCDAL